MSYLIAHMLEGEAADWHRSIAQDISERFGTWKVHEAVAPHLTVFYPFDTDKIGSVCACLSHLVEREPDPGPILLKGFDHFDDNVVFAKVYTDAGVDSKVKELQEALEGIIGSPRSGFRSWNPHATLAHRVPKETIRRIWEYVQTLPTPEFHLDFDNITFFTYERERKWSVEKVFRFKSEA